jgi:hypothetical protein
LKITKQEKRKERERQKDNQQQMQAAIRSINTTGNPLHTQEESEDAELLTFEQLNEKRGISTHTWAALMFIGYLIIGLIFYCYFRVPTLSALDAIYLAVITFTTVGYGEMNCLCFCNCGIQFNCFFFFF